MDKTSGRSAQVEKHDASVRADVRVADGEVGASVAVEVRRHERGAETRTPPENLVVECGAARIGDQPAAGAVNDVHLTCGAEQVRLADRGVGDAVAVEVRWCAAVAGRCSGGN